MSSGTLVLTRVAGKSVMIGDDVKVAVRRVHPDGSVELAFTAPKDVKILREEAYLKGTR